MLEVKITFDDGSTIEHVDVKSCRIESGFLVVVDAYTDTMISTKNIFSYEVKRDVVNTNTDT